MVYSWPMTRPTRRIIVLTTVALIVAAVVVVSGLWVKGVADTASAGRTNALGGAHALAALDTTTAISSLEAASHDFTGLRGSLGPDWVARAVGALPWIGRQYTTTRTLAGIGADASGAGVVLARLLQAAGSSGETSRTSGGLVSVLAARHVEVEGALASLADAADRAAALRADGLVPPLARAVVSVQAALRTSSPALGRARTLLPLMSFLLSSERRVLVVSQDGAELRPTGGFAGSFGIVDVGPSGVRLEAYRDVYGLPDPPGRVAPPAGARMTQDFGFRDANWWIDFPTSARAMLGFWTAYRQPRVDGVIAIDTVMMKELLSATGPVEVPSVHETFTSGNLLGRLLYLVELKKGAGKDVLVSFAEALEKRVLLAAPADLAESSKALGQAADEKHVQMYFIDPGAQAAVEAAGWSGRVSASGGVTDLLAVSNAMTKPGKVNAAMRKTIEYRVMLGGDRSADTTLVLGFANTGPYPLPLPSIFRDWLRVYRVPRTVFPASTPAGRRTMTATEFGLPAEIRTFRLFRGQSRVETLTARVPGAVRTDAAATPGRVLYYRLRVIRQADLEDVPTTVTVSVRPGLVITAASARFTASGAPVPVAVQRSSVRMSVPLRGDLEIEVRISASR